MRNKAGYDKEYYRKNVTARRQATKEYFRKARIAVVEMLGGKCIRCGFDDRRALQIDHIGGNGTKDRKKITGVYWNSVMKSVLNGEEKYQLLCANCNWIKRYEKGEHRKAVN